jgi:hypothetical protein
MRFVLAIATAGVLAFTWLVYSRPAEARTRHVKPLQARSVVPYHRPYATLPPPGYSIGGPNYTACDRMNHDRMLYGRRC